MDWFRGLRAATAVSVPMLLGGLLHVPLLAWAALGGFEAIIADPGGPYRHRIQSIAVLTVGGAAGCFVGTLAGQHLDYAIAVTLLWCFLWSYLLVLGAPFASAGTLVQVIYFCGLGAPSAHLAVASAHAGYLLLGGLWAMLLSLFLWPVDPYRPARFAVGDCYLELASFLNSIQELNLRQRSRPALWHRLARHHQGRVRRALEKAREAIAGVRSQRASESVRTNNLVVLLESADLVLARTVALAEFLEATSAADLSGCVQRAKASLLLLSKAEEWIADVLRRRLHDFEETSRSFQLRLQRIPNDMAQCLAPDDADGQFLLHQMAEVTQNLEIALDSVVAVRAARDPHTRRARALPSSTLAPPLTPLTWREKLRANWNPESLMLRHAIRITAVCGLEVWILYHFHINHGYWLPLTSLIVLQPHLSGTFRRSLQRMGGTIAGGILAAVLAVLLHSQTTMAAAIFPMALLTLAVYPVSYTLFCFFLTPTFVLVSLPYFGDWQLAALRIGNTVLGAVLALLAMSFLWPAWERDRFGLQLERSLEANRRYLDALAASWQSAPNATRSLVEARRAIGLAHNDSEDSLDRLVLEPSLPGTASRRAAAEAVEPAIAFVAYLRRFGQSITTLAASPLDETWKRSAPVQQQLAAMRRELDQLIHAVRGEAEVRRPALETPADSRHPGQRQLRRMERQIAVMARNLEAMQRAHLFPSHPVTMAREIPHLR